MAKKKTPPLNALQAAQLKDCINAGTTIRVVLKPAKPDATPKPAPLFFPEPEQSKLF